MTSTITSAVLFITIIIMKIAISGSAGTGKSTLCRMLSTELGLTHIDENYEPVYDARLKGDFPPRILKILNHKRTLENNAHRFVSDRCPLDLMHMWLNQTCHKIAPKLTNTFFDECRQQIHTYDFVILTPWNSFKLVQNTSALPREMNIMEQLRNHAGIVGQTHLWVAKARIIEIPSSINSIDERTSFVIATIKKRRPELLQPTSSH